jgi:four helix bundle protein
MTVRSYKDLRVWQRAMDLVCATHALSNALPPEERHRLGDQLRRASVSVAANIAEGHSRTHRKEFLHFLTIAHASLTETETHLTIALRVGYVDRKSYTAPATICEEVGRMLTAMRARLGEAHLKHATRPSPRAVC